MLSLVLASTMTGMQVETMHGAGTTNPSKLFWEAMSLMKARSRLPLHLTYRAVGSSTGQKEFLGDMNNYQAHNDFGAGDIPMTAWGEIPTVAVGPRVIAPRFLLDQETNLVPIESLAELLGGESLQMMDGAILESLQASLKELQQWIQAINNVTFRRELTTLILQLVRVLISSLSDVSSEAGEAWNNAQQSFIRFLQEKKRALAQAKSDIDKLNQTYLQNHNELKTQHKDMDAWIRTNCTTSTVSGR